MQNDPKIEIGIAIEIEIGIETVLQDLDGNQRWNTQQLRVFRRPGKP